MKNTFKVVLINTVTCAAIFNNCGYTNPPKQMNIDNINVAPVCQSNMNDLYPNKQVNNEIISNNLIPNNNVSITEQTDKKKLQEIANKKDLPKPVQEDVKEYLKLMNPDIKNKDKFLKKLAHARDIINIHKDMQGENAHPNSGLNNIGSTCYMNAVLQLFAGLPYFVKSMFKVVEYSDNYKKLLTTKNGILTLEFTNVIAEIIGGGYKDEEDPNQFTENTSFSPDTFKAILSKCNSLFQGIQANDSKDLFLYLVEIMHNALNTVISMPVTQQPANTVDQTNYQQVFNSFSKNFIENYESVLSRYFYGVQTAITCCANCCTTMYNSQIYNMLISPLEEVRQRRDSVFPCCYGQPLLLQDCFAYNEKLDIFTGQNAVYCNYCQQQYKAGYRTKLEYLPNILTLNLNRGKGNQFNVRISIPQFMDASDFTNQKLPEQFALSGFVCHIGPSSSAGHFVYFGKKSPDAPWYQYNDSLVSKEVDEKLVNQILSGQNGNMIPYLVTYEKLRPTEAAKYKDKMVTLSNNYPPYL